VTRTLADDVTTLGRCLGTVIREQEGERFFALLERIRTRTKDLRQRNQDGAPMQAELAVTNVDDAGRLVRAFSIYFQLINLAEEHDRVRKLGRREGVRPESLEATFLELRDAGMRAEDVRVMLARTNLGLTFTAHPTEMRRRTVRAHTEKISELLYGLDSHAPGVLGRITAHVEALWATPQLRARRPEVRDEVKAGLAYIEVIAGVLPDLDFDLREAFLHVFAEPLGATNVPVSFHSWVGGDRDGNPNVTPEVTAQTFDMHADRARRGLLAALEQAYAWLSHAREPSSELSVDGADAFRSSGPAAPVEPARQELADLRAALLRGEPRDPEAVASKLQTALVNAGLQRGATELLRQFRVRAHAFGLHLVSLDVREHSQIVGKAVAELLTIGEVPGYADLDEDQKTKVLASELSSKRALLPVSERGNESALIRSVLGPLLSSREAMARNGSRAFGRYIVSMSEQPSDLLEVLVLGREAGVRLAPVPLFETLADLARAPAVMRQVLALPVYRAALGDDLVQEIMIGYSDSNKDAGFLAANVALYEAQADIGAVCADAGVRYRFFHGRGTSIGRGGGPMARGLLGQPPGTMDDGLRITEQGEALGNKYSHPALAYRNLEQGLYGLLVAAAKPKSDLPSEMLEAMRKAAATSVAEYRALVTHPAFLRFFEDVTPINEIARLQIASRPVRRPGPPNLASLRAIPWVMAWTQCRANVPGWYGLGAGLGALDPVLLRDMYARWPFFRSMIDNAQMSLAKTEMGIFQAYRTLTNEHALGDRVVAAFHSAVNVLRAVTGGDLLHDEPVLARSIKLRNPYIEPIHRLQVELIRRARKLPANEPLPPQLERPLLLSLHGISAGMRNTG
jgi:phosphoenolpyruvate carboxylase